MLEIFPIPILVKKLKLNTKKISKHCLSIKKSTDSVKISNKGGWQSPPFIEDLFGLKNEILKYGDHKIILNTKAEVIAGSTRLKAGTAQKICLNVISSMVMLKMGRVKNGVMNEMVPTNEKLRLRKKLINLIN